MRIPLLPLLCAAALTLTACASTQRPSISRQVQEAFTAADADHDEQLSPEEFANLPLKDAAFADLDTDDNGRISLAELQSYLTWRRVQAEGNRPLMSDGQPRRY